MNVSNTASPSVVTPVRRSALAFALLAIEAEWFFVGNYELRTSLRSLLQLPLYHILLGFLSFYALQLYLKRTPGPLRWSSEPTVLFVSLHLLTAVLLKFSLPHINALLLRGGSSPGLLLWATLTLGFLASWLALLVKPRHWRPFWSELLQLSPVPALAALAMPYIAAATSALWPLLARVTFSLTSSALGLMYPVVISNPETRMFGTPRFQVEIENGCSGAEGIGVMLCFLVAYAVLKGSQLNQGRWLRLLFGSLCTAWVCNLLRILALVIIGSEISPWIALRGFHSQAGWLTFSLLALIAIYLGERSAEKIPEEALDWTHSYPTLPYLAPMLVAIVALMASRAASQDSFEATYPFRALALALVCLRFRPRLRWPGRRAMLGGFIVYLYWRLLESDVLEGAVNPFTLLYPPWPWIWIASHFAGSVLLVPIAEELAFRGFLLRRLHSPQWDRVEYAEVSWLAMIGSSIAFGFLHRDILAGTLAGLVYAQVARKEGLSGAICAHALTNLGLAAEVLLLGRWSLWA